MEATVSLSKGVFAFKRNKNNKNSFLSANYWRREEGRDDPDIQEISLRNYQNCWSTINHLIEERLNDTHSRVFEHLVNYVKKVGFAKCEKLRFNGLLGDKDIPAACLVTGVNMPDHATIFDNLSKSLVERVSPHVARLSTDCSNIKMAIYKLVFSLINEDEQVVFESDSEDEIFANSKPSKGKKIKKANCNMATLSSWYKEQGTGFKQEKTKTDSLGFSESPSKKQKISKGKQNVRDDVACGSPSKLSQKRKSVTKGDDDGSSASPDDEELGKTQFPIVIIIENVESVSVQFLQDLILITSEYQKAVPFVFIFGVSTTPSYIHRHLSQEASACIAMETFQAQPSSILLSEIIEKVLMTSRIPFHLGGRVFKLLLDIFLFHDLSVKNFVAGLKFCILEHYVRGDASFLCCSKEERFSILQRAPRGAVAALRKLPSFKKYEDTLSQEERNNYLNDAYLCKKVEMHLNEFEGWYMYFCALVKILHCLVHALPGNPLGRQVREVLSMCLCQQITDCEEFQSAWKLLSMSSIEELSQKVHESLQILTEYEGVAEVDILKQKLLILCERISCLRSTQVKDEETEPKKSPFLVELKPSDRFYLREKLLGSQKMITAKNSFEELRLDILNCFEHVFISHLKSFSTKPFHEVFFFDLAGSVKYQLLGSLRATITTGLVNPHKYLQCPCCKLEKSENLIASLPDLSICYKLHVECGRLINLFDWLEAFVSVIGGDDESNANQRQGKKKKKTLNEVHQARFIQAVSELQFLGFVKPTKRKTDHVQRLTWGGC